jgi:hypothetical protein
LVGRALEDFAPKAQEIIEQNLHFFSLLNIELRNRIYAQLLQLEVVDWDKLPQTIPIFTSAQVEELYQRAESEESAAR